MQRLFKTQLFVQCRDGAFIALFELSDTHTHTQFECELNVQWLDVLGVL